MSNTRHAAPGSPLRQERFASSFGHGLLANLVAKRCAEIDPPADRAAIWFAQLESWKRGGLELVASEILRRHPLLEWRPEMAGPRGSIHPNLERMLASQLEDLCLNPRSALGDVWDALDGCRSEWLSALAPIAETSVSQRVFGALDYTRDVRTLTLIDGPARIGKSYSAQAWCDRTAGLARYVQVPCSNDDIGFFRAIGRALGVSASLQLKASEIRNRVEEVLQLGDLMLVLDESQYCWPQSWQRYAMPSRVNWILQALVNFNVPVEGGSIQ